MRTVRDALQGGQEHIVGMNGGNSVFDIDLIQALTSTCADR